MNGVVFSRKRTKHGVIHGAVCHSCPGDPVLVWSWHKGEVRAIGQRHASEHRMGRHRSGRR